MELMHFSTRCEIKAFETKQSDLGLEGISMGQDWVHFQHKSLPCSFLGAKYFVPHYGPPDVRINISMWATGCWDKYKHQWPNPLLPIPFIQSSFNLALVTQMIERESSFNCIQKVLWIITLDGMPPRSFLKWNQYWWIILHNKRWVYESI